MTSTDLIAFAAATLELDAIQAEAGRHSERAVQLREAIELVKRVPEMMAESERLRLQVADLQDLVELQRLNTAIEDKYRARDEEPERTASWKAEVKALEHQAVEIMKRREERTMGPLLNQIREAGNRARELLGITS